MADARRRRQNHGRIGLPPLGIALDINPLAGTLPRTRLARLIRVEPGLPDERDESVESGEHAIARQLAA